VLEEILYYDARSEKHQIITKNNLVQHNPSSERNHRPDR